MKFLDKLMQGARMYSVFDFGMLKLALVFAGILIGAYFANFFVEYIVVVWILAGFCCGWIIIRTLIKAGFICKKCNE